MSYSVLPGAEPWSHVTGPGAPGVLCLHGFTGNPSSMRAVAQAFGTAGFHVELPRLPGHGTHVEDMKATRWDDWAGAADAAYRILAERATSVVVAGLSMGGSLTLWLGTRHPEIAGLICVNPATLPQAPEVVDMVEDFLAQGMEAIPGIGADLADPQATESAYEAAPLRPLLSLSAALGELSSQYPELAMPLLLCSSAQDHVVDPAQGDFLATTYGGPVERVVLERSYHVATLDYDAPLIIERALGFARRVAGLS
jgi:carboxylesterase